MARIGNNLSTMNLRHIHLTLTASSYRYSIYCLLDQIKHCLSLFLQELPFTFKCRCSPIMVENLCQFVPSLLSYRSPKAVDVRGVNPDHGFHKVVEVVFWWREMGSGQSYHFHSFTLKWSNSVGISGSLKVNASWLSNGSNFKKKKVTKLPLFNCIKEHHYNSHMWKRREGAREGVMLGDWRGMLLSCSNQYIAATSSDNIINKVQKYRLLQSIPSNSMDLLHTFLKFSLKWCIFFA